MSRLLVVILSAAVAVAVPAAPGAAQKSEVVVGTALGLTGRFSTEATEHLRAYQLFLEELNGGGGVPVKAAGKKLPVRLLHYDDQSDTSAAAKLYERLVTTDKVDLLFSPWGSGPNFAVTAVTEKHKVPVVLASAGADNIYTRGFKYIYNTTDLASAMPKPLIDFLKTRKGEVRKLAAVYENFLFTTTLNEVFVKGMQAEGFELALSERYPLGTQDFTGLMTKVKPLGADAVVVYCLMPACLYAARQIREVGVAPKLVFINIGPMYAKEFLEPLGPAAEGIVETGFWHPDLPYPGARAFATKYQAKYGKPPSTDAAYAWMAAQILFQAVEKAGTLDREAINEALKREELTSIGGLYKYDARGVNIHSRPFLTQVQDGRRVIAWPPDLTRTPLRFPMPR
jgi:branched-chain amino acid transport system substrate-binding protein